MIVTATGKGRNPDREPHSLLGVRYPGHPGSYFDQPEPAELVVWCPRGRVTDAQTFDTPYPEETISAYCYGCETDVEVRT